MEIRTITPDYSVSPQVRAEDMAALRAAGFKAVICNRPDEEVPPGEQAEAIRTAAEAEGLTFVYNPVTNGAMTADNIETQGRVLDEAGGPVFAYCRSGTRSTIVWALSQAGERPVDDIIAEAGHAGYDLAGMRPQIEAFAGKR
ncbi:TIGR01244 family sulfur transferase [Tranquillimonas alkanivorans]|uniref:TIGR01244 family protein n=1 Tax=Tranquillimonas alkanivorans TaxID=441119 RepID=A0A1I5SQ35_9RHOB|nr:TIGR01244 family sulfur transferase [Tranquillimonas alkanivorans]SFP72863.1 TIGR01244 family protein [Tranquillimonas alkanivorans]